MAKVCLLPCLASRCYPRDSIGCRCVCMCVCTAGQGCLGRSWGSRETHGCGSPCSKLRLFHSGHLLSAHQRVPRTVSSQHWPNCTAFPQHFAKAPSPSPRAARGRLGSAVAQLQRVWIHVPGVSARGGESVPGVYSFEVQNTLSKIRAVSLARSGNCWGRPAAPLTVPSPFPCMFCRRTH